MYARRLLLVSLAAILAMLPVVGTLAAEETPNFIIRTAGNDQGTPYFTVQLRPGESKKLTVELGITSSSKLRIRTYVADTYTLINGGMGVKSSEDEKTAETNWVHFSTKEMTLKPNQTKARTFSVVAPKDAEPGEYLASLIIENAKPVKGSGTIALDQVYRKTLPILMLVPGALQPQLEFGKAAYQNQGDTGAVSVAVGNTGNQRLSCVATFTLSDASGKQMATTSLELLSIYAGDETSISVGISKALAPGDYLVGLTLTDDSRDFTVSRTDIPLHVEGTVPVTPEIARGASIGSFTVNELRDPTSQALQVVEGVIVIDNTGDPLYNARLTMHVKHDGQIVEDVVLGSALSFPGGSSEFRQRYIPLSGWSIGTWEFSLSLESVDPSSGAATALNTATTSIDISE